MNRCQHCERDIEPTGNGYWMDTDGIMVCVKRTPGDAGYLLHQPMPEVAA